ncbi:MAG: polysaccharide pyruvyl transferase family protein [Akkermansia sp.]|nr:polysaccharide pyruvyl transferase family protein [Akkermansia sp.]
MGAKPLVLDQSALSGVAKWGDKASISRAFMRRHAVPCSGLLRTDADFQALNDRLQTFIIGSDQVWRWLYTKQYGLLHFLDFVRGDKRKIAVASSFGIDTEERPADSARKAGYYLRSFDAVSVREESGLELLRRHYGVEGEWIADPVFLCGAECYDELTADTETPTAPYLLSYVLEPDEKIKQLIEAIASERGLEVINMVDAHGDFEKLRARFGGIGNIAQGITPEQWVAYIRHCSYFVTDSFHGVCFAHLFHKDFVCVAPPERGLTRFTSLLGQTGLLRCLLPPDYSAAELKTATGPIDWPGVQAVLDAARTKGCAWLQQALAAPRSERAKAQSELLYELLYAGSGRADRNRDLETLVQQQTQRYRHATLPKLIRLKKAVLRLLSLCPIPAVRRRAASRLRTQQRLAQYLQGEHAPAPRV